jgi:hypothetical protein
MKYANGTTVEIHRAVNVGVLNSKMAWVRATIVGLAQESFTRPAAAGGLPY